MPSWFNRKHEKDSFLYNLRSTGSITHTTVSYNITFKAAEWQNEKDSYIQLGPISRDVSNKVAWFETSGWDIWGVPLPFSYFKHDGKLFPCNPEEAQGVFDP